MSNEIKVSYTPGLGNLALTVDVFKPDGTERQFGIALAEAAQDGLYLGDCSGIVNGDVIVAYHGSVYIGGEEYDDGLARKVLVNKAVQDKLTGAVSYYDDDGAAVILTHTPTEDADSVERTVS